ncbi:MAG: hypothetical protein JST39_21485, partial [Bacteroidetes bacterium]|nr:hypothetical protein [Bacteroidota bacterium]
MKYLFILFALGYGACTPIKLSVPTAFKEQATEFHVNGARKNRMSFGEYKTSRIRRGMHVLSSGSYRDFSMENILLNSVGLDKEELVSEERAKFRYKLSAGEDQLEVWGREESTKNSIAVSLGRSPSSFGYERPVSYDYIFSSVIKTDTAAGAPRWELVM